MDINTLGQRGFSAEQEKLYEQLLKEQGIHIQSGRSDILQTGLNEGQLSFAQERIWFLQQVEPESTSFHISLMVRIQGIINIEALNRSFNEILRRHQILRTTFTEKTGQLLQVVLPPSVFRLPVMNFTETDSLKPDAWHSFLLQEVRQRFDLENGPMWRLKLFQQAENDHFLLWVCHHLIIDGWSVGLLLQELLTLYDAFRVNQPTPLPELPFQYLDYSSWQRRLLQNDFLQNELAYWKNQLHGAPPVLELPTDYPRPKIQTSRGSFIEISIPDYLLGSLKKQAEHYGVTLFMLLLAVFDVLLYRYTQQEDILVGTPVAGRGQREWEGNIGLFVNNVVLRVKLDGATPFEDFLAQVRQVALDAFAHQNLPFEKLVEALHPERNLSYSPLFQVMFVMQNAPLPEIKRPDLHITTLTVDGGFAQFDLSATVWEEAGLLKGTFEFNTDLFAKETIRRMIEHYQLLLQGVIHHPGAEIAKLPMVTPAEQHQIFDLWNSTAAEFEDSTIARLFEAQVERSPKATAVIFGAWRFSYAELNRRANQLAHYLKNRGVIRESPVGVYLETSLELMVGILGILKAGGAYIPLDPVYPKERLNQMLDDAQAELVITQTQLEAFLPGNGRNVITLDGDGPVIASFPETNPVLETSSADLACIIYTSGTTGLPRGVMLEHRGIANLIASFITSYQPTPIDRISPLTSLGSASFVGEIFPLLCAGGALVLIDKANFLDFDCLLEQVTANEITIMSTVPAVMAKLNSETIKPTKLRLLLSGGEALSWNDIDRLVHSVTVVNGYGLTETSICSTYVRLDQSSLAAKETITIGRPVINHQIFILDPYFNCQPIGVPGEIYIGGLGLARGYLNNPELTADRFISDPRFPGERLYRTGDQGLWLPNGTIKFLGRIDKQIKIRGFRIELAEIEACLGDHPAVQDLYLAVRTDGRNEKRLVAYVVAREDRQVSRTELRDWLREKLPEYMVPSAFVFLIGLPLNPNGKVNPEDLPEALELHLESGNGVSPPQTPTEQRIAGIWMEVLNLPQVGVADNFFDLGGHSLLLTQVHRSLKNQVPKELTIIDLFKYPDIRSLAAYIDDADQTQRDTAELYHHVKERAQLQNAALQRQQQVANRMKNKLHR